METMITVQHNTESTQKGFDFLVEREKLLNNMRSLKNVSARIVKLAQDLKCVYEDVEYTRMEVQSLEASLNEASRIFRAPPTLIGRKS